MSDYVNMNKNFEWVLISLKKYSTNDYIFVTQIVAKKMRGWKPCCSSFSRQISNDAAPACETVGNYVYTDEIHVRKGGLALTAYEDFAQYVGSLPLVAYDLKHNYDNVLLPEWQRLGISRIGVPGFCIMQLAKRLLDPLPTDNCELQQYHRLRGDRGHTAFDDLWTLLSLIQEVLYPLIEKQGLSTWKQVVDYATCEWYPSRLTFGKYKGRLYQEAREESGLREWLEWLSHSTNELSSAMGCWYLKQLEGSSATGFLDYAGSFSNVVEGIVRSENLIIQRLMDVEFIYDKEKSNVMSIRSKLFGGLRSNYFERDQLRILVNCRKAFIVSLLTDGEEAADAIKFRFQAETSLNASEYVRTEASLFDKQEKINEENVRANLLWQKLLRISLSGLNEQNPSRRQTFERLGRTINEARYRGDIDLLELAAQDPEDFILEKGWTAVSLDETGGVEQIRSFYEHIQVRILEMIESLGEIRRSPEMEIYRASEENESVIEEIVAAQRKDLEQEIATLKAEAESVAEEARELAGDLPF